MANLIIMKDGLTSEIGELVWKMNKENMMANGWQLKGSADDVENVPVKNVHIDTELVKVGDVDPKEKVYPDDNGIRAFLSSRGIKFHQRLGQKKLRILYDENSK